MPDNEVHLKYGGKDAVCGKRDSKKERIILTTDPSLVTCNECKFLMKEDK